MRERDLALPSGRLRALERGPADGPLVLCAHGLSANAHAFDVVGERLEAAGHRVVALDLRGRGHSDVTAPGSYGLAAHAADMLDAADILGAERFALLGWSMGALIGLVLAARARDRLTALGLIDHAGAMDAAAVDAVRRGLARLDAVVDDPDEYVAAIRAASAIERWGPFWDAFYRYELAQRDDGRWAPLTDAAACREDLDEAVAHDWERLWRHVPEATALLRCGRPLNGGFVVPEAVRDAFAAAAPAARVVDVDANHFDVMTDETALAALDELVAATA
jgi:pimeloyl-ACP methyl ester carboxylesterase